MQGHPLAGADASRRQRRGRGAKPAGQDRMGGRGGTCPAWLGRAPAASEQPHPGHGGMRPAAGARSPTQRAGQEIGLLCTAHRLPAPSRAAPWSLLLLRRSLIGHPDFPVSCCRETGPNGAGMLAFRNAPEAAAEPKPKLFPVFSRPSGKTAPQRAETGSLKTASTTNRKPLFSLAFCSYDTCPETPGNPGLCRRCQNMRAVGDAARPRAAAEWWRTSHPALSAVRVFQAWTRAAPRTHGMRTAAQSLQSRAASGCGAGGPGSL